MLIILWAASIVDLAERQHPRETLARDTWYVCVDHFAGICTGVEGRGDSGLHSWASKPHLLCFCKRGTTNAAWASYICCKANSKMSSESGSHNSDTMNPDDMRLLLSHFANSTGNSLSL
jgi:hypothetical protein